MEMINMSKKMLVLLDLSKKVIYFKFVKNFITIFI